MKTETDTFEVISYENPFSGGVTDKFKLKRKVSPNLDEKIIKTANFIIDNTHHMNWSKFISLVYSSYPVKNSEKYTFLDLPKFSKKFRLEKSN